MKADTLIAYIAISKSLNPAGSNCPNNNHTMHYSLNLSELYNEQNNQKKIDQEFDHRLNPIEQDFTSQNPVSRI